MVLKLALRVGEYDVDKMMKSMSCQQFAEWCAYDQIDPFGAERQDLNFAMVLSMLAQVFGNKNARPEKYMPFADAKTKTAGNLKSAFAGFTGNKPSD